MPKGIKNQRKIDGKAFQKLGQKTISSFTDFQSILLPKIDPKIDENIMKMRTKTRSEKRDEKERKKSPT